MRSTSEHILGDNKNTLGHRVIRLSMDEEALEERDASLIAKSRSKISVHSILSSMEKEGITSIKVKQISDSKFLLTFPTKHDKLSWDLGWLDPWFSSFVDASHKELILPRRAWLNCEGLPISLWNVSNWERIAKE